MMSAPARRRILASSCASASGEPAAEVKVGNERVRLVDAPTIIDGAIAPI